MMKGICLRYAENEAEAEDILQDAFVLAFRKLDTFKGTGELGGWLRKLTVNKALEYCRKRKSVKKLIIPFSEKQRDEPITENVFDQLEAADLIAKIQNLPVGYRTVFNLYAVEGYSHKEIAEKLTISVGTSKSQFSRARAFLIDQIAKELELEEKKLNYARG